MAARLFVVFTLGPTRYGIAIESVEEIIPALPITRLPHSRRETLGVIEVRGRVVPVYDLHRRFHAQPPAATADARMVLVALPGGPVALPVDAVEEVASVDAADVQSVDLPGDAVPFLSGVVRVRDRLVLWIDPARLVPASVLRRPSKLRKAA